MPFDKRRYLTALETASIDYETSGTGEYKGDHFVADGGKTPHIHVSKSGEFVGFKKKRGAMTTLVKGYQYNIESIRTAIDDVKESTAANDQDVTEALKVLARLYKTGGE